MIQTSIVYYIFISKNILMYYEVTYVNSSNSYNFRISNSLTHTATAIKTLSRNSKVTKRSLIELLIAPTSNKSKS